MRILSLRRGRDHICQVGRDCSHITFQHWSLPFDYTNKYHLLAIFCVPGWHTEKLVFKKHQIQKGLLTLPSVTNF